MFPFQIKGYPSYTAQLNVNTTGGPPTKRRFAERTVDFMDGFIVSVPDRLIGRLHRRRSFVLDRASE